MDKHEFNIKVDQIKKMVSKGDFETAMKIADTIDWRRVRNANLLSMISSVYEKNAEYQEAKDILLIAFERAPIGKRLLYKLTQLALKEGDIAEAESYYREFCDLAGDDSRQDILRYLILKAKGAPAEQLIHTLESYTSIELDEKWLYELADLYHQAGNADECVKTCDKIMLMFGLGQYVDKAMELKLQYAPLTKYQMDLVENRDKYEEKLRQVEQNGISAVISPEEPLSREEEEIAAAARRGQVAAAYAEPSLGQVNAGYAEAPSAPANPEYAQPPAMPMHPGYADPSAAPVQPGYAAPSAVPMQPGYADPSIVSVNPGYVQASAVPSNAGYVQPSAASANPGYTQASAASANSGYAQASAASANPGYAQASAASANPGYAQASDVSANAGYAQASAISANAGYTQAPSGSAAQSEEERAREDAMVSNIAASFAAAAAEPQGKGTNDLSEESLEVSMKEAEVEASLAEEMSKISMDGYREEPVREKTRVLDNVKDLKKAGEPTEKTKVLDEIRHIQTAKSAEGQALPKETQSAASVSSSHIMVESRTAEEGLRIAVETLKKAHQILDYKHPAAKISGEKLNQRGILASAPKLAGKDLIVESAGDLSDAMLEELDKFLSEAKQQTLVVLVDNPRQMEGIRRISPSLAARFKVVTSVEEAQKVLYGMAGQKRNRKEEPISEQPSQTQRKAEFASASAAKNAAQPVSSSAVQREAQASARPSAAEREAQSSARPSAAEREAQSSARPSAAEREAQSSARPSAAEREAQAPARPVVVQREEPSARNLAAQRESESVRSSDVYREAATARQPKPQRETSVKAIKPADAELPVSGDTKVFSRIEASHAETSRAETAASSNIVQMRTPKAPIQDDPEFAKQDQNQMDEPDDDQIMDVDEFAQYCCHYASQIDCNISRKSMLALYERVEIMEEDGVALTKAAAEDLIEEAADRAEKPSLGKRITGLFSSKYDKEGLLILKEEHFI